MTIPKHYDSRNDLPSGQVRPDGTTYTADEWSVRPQGQIRRWNAATKSWENTDTPAACPAGCLFGYPGADDLYDTIEDAVEDVYDTSDVDGPGDAIEIHEWTVHPPRHHFPTAERIAEDLKEWIGDGGELSEGYYKAFPTAAAEEAAETLLATVAAAVTYRMADKHVATHHVTIHPKQSKTP